MTKQTIGSFLSTMRKANGYTQQEVADKLGISNRTLSGWECDKTLPDILLLPALAELYGVTVDEILCGERRSKEKTSITGKSEKSILKNKLAKFSMQAWILFGIIVAGIILSFAGLFVEISTVTWVGWPWWRLILFIGLTAVIVSIGILFAFWKNAEISTDDSMDGFKSYCILLRKNLAICLYCLSAVMLFPSLIASFSLNYYLEYRYGMIFIIILFLVLPIVFFVAGWVLCKNALARWGGESALSKFLKDKQYFWTVTFWGLIPLAVAIIAMVVFSFWHPVVCQKVYTDNPSGFTSYMETNPYDSSGPLGLSSLEQRIDKDDNVTRYTLNGGQYQCTYLNGTFRVYIRRVTWDNVWYDYAFSAQKLTTSDGGYSVFNVRFAEDIESSSNVTNIGKSAVSRYQIKQKGSQISLMAYYAADISEQTYIVGIAVIACDIMVCASLCVKRRLNYTVKL